MRVVSQLIHFTDWVPGYVHMGTMGWVTMVATASMYYVVPKIFKTEIYSVTIANIHFWLVLVGSSFLRDHVDHRHPAGRHVEGHQPRRHPHLHVPRRWRRRTLVRLVRLLGGLLYFAGIVVFTYNLYMTSRPKARAV